MPCVRVGRVDGGTASEEGEGKKGRATEVEAAVAAQSATDRQISFGIATGLFGDRNRSLLVIVTGPFRNSSRSLLGLVGEVKRGDRDRVLSKKKKVLSMLLPKANLSDLISGSVCNHPGADPLLLFCHPHLSSSPLLPNSD